METPISDIPYENLGEAQRRNKKKGEYIFDKASSIDMTYEELKAYWDKIKKRK